MFKILVFVFLFSALLSAQNLKDEIRSIENNFKSFEYKKVLQKGKFLLSDPFTTREDSLLIFQYMLSSAYALNDSIQAKTIILDLLKKQPDFSLNPKNTSPKIVEFFNLIKDSHKKPAAVQPVDTSRTIKTEQLNLPDTKTLIAGILLPGSAHLLDGKKEKGYLFTTVSTILLGTTAYFFIATNSDRQTYMDARGSADYNALYNSYNRSYKIRNSLSVLYGLWSLYGLYDFYKPYTIQPVYDKTNQSLSLNYQFNW